MENLNVVLTVSTRNEMGNRTLRGYCRNFPGLLGHTTINWMSAWPKEAWTCIAKAFLGEHPKVSGVRGVLGLIKEVSAEAEVLILNPSFTFRCVRSPDP